jgi:hypothetical protein
MLGAALLVGMIALLYRDSTQPRRNATTTATHPQPDPR